MSQGPTEETEMTTETLTDTMIRDLRTEAAAQGDDSTVHCCWVALGERDPGGGQQWPASIEEARQGCADIITDARGMDDDGDFVRVVA